MTTLRSVEDLVSAGLINPAAAPQLEAVVDRYSLSITKQMAELINPDDPQDPLARQFVPDRRELEITDMELRDPIGDEKHSPVPGLVHRYPDRVLFKLLHICPVYCRFCFRREQVGREGALSAQDFIAAVDYIARHPEVWEVVFSGGDPLLLSERRIHEAIEALRSLAHVKILRWHTRVPVVSPERVTASLIDILKQSGKTVYIALHINHPSEIGAEAERAIAMLADAGLPLLSQSVLLRGVNDDADILEQLMRRLVELRIKPYYLHHPDLAPGTAHFRLPITQGQDLTEELRRRASGLCQPAYMLDVPGGHSKVPLARTYLTGEGKSLIVRDIWGEQHAYPAKS